MLWSAARRPRARPLAARTACRRTRDRAQVPRGHADPRERLADVLGPRSRHRLHAAARDGARHHSDRRGARRRGANAHRARDQARLRLGRPVAASARRADAAGDRRPRRPPPPDADQPRARRHDARRRIQSPGRRARAVRAHVVPVPHGAPCGRQCRARACRHGAVLAGLDSRLHLRRRVQEGRHHVADGAQGPDVRPDGRDRRRAHDVPAGTDRRRPQLGLPLLLASGRDVHALRADERRLHRRGAGLARVAVALGRRRPGEGADPLRRRRPATRRRVRARLAARVRRLAAGAHRERGARAVPARRLRRGDGRACTRPGRTGSIRTTTPGRSSAR